MPWILNEDTALKLKLEGIKVTTSAGLVDVPVVWAVPELEAVDMTYPIIVLNEASIAKADDRERRGFTWQYTPEGSVAPPDGALWGYFGEHPIPYNFDYTANVFARSRKHRIEIVSALASGYRIPDRYGFLELPTVDKVVSLDLIGGPEMTSYLDTDDKRTFTANYKIRVYSEFSPFEVRRFERVQRVIGTVVDAENKQALIDFDDLS